MKNPLPQILLWRNYQSTLKIYVWLLKKSTESYPNHWLGYQISPRSKYTQ